MQYRILGSLEVALDGLTLDLGTPKQRAVVALLLAHADRVVSLDRMIDLLWGDEGAARATAVLQVYISNLRRTLEPGRAPRTSPQVLVTQAPGYRLRVGPDEMDAACFEARAGQGHQLLRQGRTAAGRDALVEALAYWRGPAFAEYASEPFARAEAARLEELRAVATESRLEAELVLGNHAGVVHDLEASVGEHPFRERLWGLLMLALYRSGRQAEALRAFSAARRVLGDEIGIDPGPALRRLEADILSQSPDLDWHRCAGDDSAAASAPAVGAAAGMAADSGRSDPAFAGPGVAGAPRAGGLVGRTAELVRLGGAVEEVARGTGRLVLVSGEAGIGKSRLLEEAAKRAAEACWVTWGRSREGQGAPPYLPWTEAIGTLLARGDPPTVRAAVGADGGELAQVLPEILGLGVTLVAPRLGDPAADRFRLHQAICDFLVRLARHRPVLLVLEDIHWADVASLELLTFVASRLQEAPLLVVASYREAGPGAPAALAEVLGSLARLPGLQRIALVGLSASDVRHFIALTTDVEPSAAAVAAVHARTEGNPFFVGELARLLISEGQLGPTSPAAPALQAVPTGVRDVIRSRLGRLPAATNELLILAAVIGRDFELPVLASAAHVEQEVALDGIDCALAAGLVREDESEIGRFGFSHTLVRDTVYGEVTALRRARLHARVAGALEVRGAVGAPLAELAHHFLLAAPVLGPEPGFRYALRAADAAQQALAYEQVEDQLHRALQLVRLMAAGPDRSELELQVQNRLAAVLAMTKGYGSPDVARAWARAHQLCREVDDSERLFGALWGLGTLHTARAEFKLLAEVAEQLLEIGAQRGSPRWLMAGHFFVGLVQLHTGPLLAARTSFATACGLAESLELSTAVADYFSQHPAAGCLGYLATTSFLVGDVEQARECQAGVLRIAIALRHPHTLAGAYVANSALAVLRRDPQAVRMSADQGLAVCQGHDFPMMESWLRAYRGWAIAELGALDAGIEEMTQAIESHQATGARIFTTAFMGLLADIEMRRGDADRAGALVDEALALSSTGEDRFYEVELYRLRAELAALRGSEHHEEAGQWLRQAIQLATDRDALLSKQRLEAALARLRGGANGGFTGGSGEGAHRKRP